MVQGLKQDQTPNSHTSRRQNYTSYLCCRVYVFTPLLVTDFVLQIIEVLPIACRDMWEGSLIDNLLNFAGTPKGLQLLQQTGRMDEGVAFMYQRYSKKLQVRHLFHFDVTVCFHFSSSP